MRLKNIIFLITLHIFAHAHAQMEVCELLDNNEKYTVNSASMLWDGGSLSVEISSSKDCIYIMFKTSKVQSPSKNKIMLSKNNSKPIILTEKSKNHIYKILSNAKIKQTAINDILLYLNENKNSAIEFFIVYDFIENMLGLKTITKENAKNINAKLLLKELSNAIQNDKTLKSRIIQNK